MAEFAVTHKPADALERALEHIGGAEGLLDPEPSMLRYVAHLILFPRRLGATELDGMRKAGWTDPDISRVNLIASCFAFMNTLADGTGVQTEANKDALAVELFGEQALADHRAWGEGAAVG